MVTWLGKLANSKGLNYQDRLYENPLTFIGGLMKEQSELEHFEKLGKEILRHKYLYYILAQPEISDYSYDMLERKYMNAAIDLKENGYDEPEVHVIAEGLWDEDTDWWPSPCTVVDFPENHPWAEEVKKQVNNS